MREGAATFADRPDGGKPFPYLLAATGGLYIIHGRARLPEHAQPPRQFIGGTLRWEPDPDGATWRFEAIANGNPPSDSTIAALNCAGMVGEAEIVLVNRAIMDALWAAGCRAARVDSYEWQADHDGAYTMTGDLVMPDVTDDCEVVDDRPTKVVARGNLADTLECLRAVFGPALEVGAWQRTEGGNLIAELRLADDARELGEVTA